MNHERTDDPTAEAARLRANPELHEAQAIGADVRYQVSLSSSNGYFVLNWSATITGTNDWIGLYENADLPDSDYIGGDNWQWAVRGSPYKTETPVKVEYQARYLKWDGQNKVYTSVARSKPWGS